MTTTPPLGALRAEYGPSPKWNQYAAASFFLLVAAGAAWLLFGFGTEVYRTGTLVVGIVAFLLGVFVIVGAVRTDQGALCRVHVYSEGFTATESGTKHVVRFEDVKELWTTFTVVSVNHGEVHRNEKYTIVAPSITLTFASTMNLQNLTQLGDLLSQEVTRSQWPRAVATLERGEPLTFSYLTIGADGLRCGQELYPWESVKRVWLKNGQILLDVKGSFLGASKDLGATSGVPNVSLFLNLAERVRESRSA